MRTAKRFLLWLAFVPVLFSAPATAMEKGIQDGWAVDDSDHLLLTPQAARLMRESGARWVRLHFRLNAAHQRWEEPLLAAYAQAVENLRREKLNILGLLTYESWSGGQAEWIANNHEVDGGNGDNAYLRDLIEKAFRPLLARFPSVRHWEIWNEPNCWTTNAPGRRDKLPGQFYIYPSNFAWVLRRAYEEAHRSPHPVKIVSGGLLGADFTGDPDADTAAPYLRDTVRMGRECAGWDDLRRRQGSWPVDGWGLHLYISGGSRTTPDYLARFPAAFVKALGQLEGGSAVKPLREVWITEIGWPTAEKGLSETDQAANVTTALAVLRAQLRIGPIFWFKMSDEPAARLFFGLRRADGSPKPAWRAFREQD